MKIFKQATLLTTLLVSLIFLTSVNQAQANIFNRFREGFYFEKYKTAEEAKVELLKLHPIGSDVQPLIETLERAGASVEMRDLKNYEKFYTKEYREWKLRGNAEAYSASYDGASPFFVVLNYLKWSVDIWSDKNRQITLIQIHKNRAY